MLTNVISSFGLRKMKVLKLISWKHSFKRLNEEYEIAKKKKQALDNLFENGRISQATRDSFDTDINAVIMEIEKQQKDLLAKMQGKAQELESQIKTLETLLANYEIQHVVGEIDEEIYQREINLLSTGLESAKHELDIIKEATNQISPPVEATTTEPSLPAEENEVVQNEGVENVSGAPEEVEVATEPAPQEPVITMEETVPEEPAIESSDTMPEETPQAVEETPEAIEDQPEVTEDMPQVIEDIPQEIEDQPQVTEEPLQSMDETPEATEDTPEVTEELSQNVEEIEDQPEITEEMPQPMEETSQIIENEPQIVEENPQTGEETPEEAHPSEAPEEAPQEISGEVIAEEEQSDEEESATAETDEDTEYQEL
jgi:hypothetical protein